MLKQIFINHLSIEDGISEWKICSWLYRRMCRKIKSNARAVDKGVHQIKCSK